MAFRLSDPANGTVLHRSKRKVSCPQQLPSLVLVPQLPPSPPLPPLVAEEGREMCEGGEGCGIISGSPLPGAVV